MDLAASIQAVLEQVVLRLTRSLAAETGIQNLCLAGGVALNCVANGKVLRDGRFEISGCSRPQAMPAARWGQRSRVYHSCQPAALVPNVLDGMSGAYLGPAFGQGHRHRLTNCGARLRCRPTIPCWTLLRAPSRTASAVGWFQGRMEFGPRALGNRSIIGDPRSAAMQKNLNLKVKYRESFRPFAPSVLRDHLSGVVRTRRR